MRLTRISARCCWVVTLNACAALLGCSLAPADIQLDDTAGSAGRGGKRTESKGLVAFDSGAPIDGGAAMRTQGGPTDAVHGAARMDPSPAVDQNAAPATNMDASIDRGMDAGTRFDASISRAADAGNTSVHQPDAGKEAGQTVGNTGRDDDAAVDGADGGPDPDPCKNGTYHCVRTSVLTNANDMLLTDATVSAVVNGYTFRGMSDPSGHAVLDLPAGHPMWLRATAPHHWPAEVTLLIPMTATTYDASVVQYEDNFVVHWYSLFRLTPDETAATLSVTFLPGVLGAGIDVGQPRAAAIVAPADGSPILLINDQLQSNQAEEDMILLNVHAGPLTLMPIAPAGYECHPILPDLVYEAHPRTIQYFNIACTETGP